MQNRNVKYQDYWVACFDILGFRRLVERSHETNILAKYQTALEKIGLRALLCSKWFSDTFLLYAKDDSEDSFDRIACAVQLFFRRMFTEWIPMRGCLNVGKFYVDELRGIFFGPSLIEAYDLAEKQNWIGLVLSDKVKDKLKSSRTEHPRSWKVFERQYCEYPVPCKGGRILNLSAYDLSYDGRHSTKDNEARQLWDSLIWMEKHAKNSPDAYDGQVIGKYDNTKNFLLEVYPVLKQNIANKDAHFPKKVRNDQ